MTEYELADLTNSTLSLVASYQDNYATHITIYLSLVFGFCAPGYIAGRKLTKFQVLLASFMFIVACVIQIFWMLTWIMSAPKSCCSVCDTFNGRNPLTQRSYTTLPPLSVFGVRRQLA
jgi:hypothetical protein